MRARHLRRDLGAPDISVLGLSEHPAPASVEVGANQNRALGREAASASFSIGRRSQSLKHPAPRPGKGPAAPAHFGRAPPRPCLD